MPKHKPLIKTPKKSKGPQSPQTADEWLQAGVDFEEAGEKWRAGDSAKSTRFFQRAIDCYGEALRKFPQSFDLAYNRARIMYEITQYPKLLAQLGGEVLDHLMPALEMSQYAVRLKPDNADSLFNLGQILTSIVEAKADGESDSAERLLQDALTAFQQCMSIQEYQYTESQTRAAEPEPEPEDTDMEGTAEVIDSLQDDRWATIIEPITEETLLDTLLAQMQVLTTFCGYISRRGAEVAWLEEYATSSLEPKIKAYAGNTSRDVELGITKANLVCALADANFRAQRLGLDSYANSIQVAFDLDLSASPDGQCGYADALIAYDTAIRECGRQEVASEVSASRWKALTSALDLLKLASTSSTPENLAIIYVMRGNLELWRHQLGLAPYSYAIATRSAATLLKNAEKFYRGAGLYASSAGSESLRVEAQVKEAMALCIQEGLPYSESPILQTERAAEILNDALEEGQISDLGL